VTSFVACRVYNAFRRAGEVRRGPRLGAALIALQLGGCGISFPMASLLPEEAPESTSSLKPKPVSQLSPELGAEDWRRAKSALAVALDPQGNGASAAWENPDSGFKGSFTPVGQAFVKSDEICRAFLASLQGRNGSSRLQGTACRLSGAEWSVKDVKPWNGRV
jgi:surface antigen